jgi:hypothetical protein
VLGAAPVGRTRGITGLVYRSVRGVTSLVGGSIDAILGRLVPLFGASPPSPRREALVAALNGVLGDYLADTANPLAIRLQFRRDGVPLPMERDALAAALPECTGKLLVLVHGLCLNDLQWNRLGSRSRRGARARSRLHAGLPQLQHRPSPLDQSARRSRTRWRRCCGNGRACPRFRDSRAQHGRARDPKRVPLRR